MAKPATILIIDDEPNILDYLSEVLQKAGHTVRQAISPEAAYKTLDQALPDLILLDVVLEKDPKHRQTDGYTVCRVLKSQTETQHIPIIFLTVMQGANERIEGLKAGAVDYIIKPFDYQEVLLRINAQLDLLQQRKLLELQKSQLQALRERERQAYVELSQQKDQFVRSVSHDLKSPLGVIEGYVKILQESPRIAALDEQEQAFLKGIADNVDWATQFIQSLLDLTRIEAGAPLRLDRTSLNGFLHACADRFSFLAKDKGLALVFEALPQELQIEVDRMRMAQVIHNLLSNAIKYTPPGGQVILRAQPSDGGVYISVEDSGYGIPARYLPQIFDKFFRVPHSKHRQQEGTGLGLSIVKAIVEQHGGQVQVESQEGQGTCFTVFLPLS